MVRIVLTATAFGLVMTRPETRAKAFFLRRRGHVPILAFALLGTSGCVSSYRDALGYRARQAALRGDVEAFDALMLEAAEEKPRSPLLKPRRTVLTHFLDLAGHDRFFAVIDGWRAKGWVSDNLTCAIHRARYRHTLTSDPAEAQRAAGICLERARAAAYAGGRSWELEACLDGAHFLTRTSTHALVPYLRVASDPAEPRALRAALLEGMTKVYLQDVNLRVTNHPELPVAGHQARALAQRRAAEARFVAIVEAVRGAVDEVLLAAGTAYGALELERASLTEPSSFLWRYALSSGAPERVDLAFAWVRVAKSRKEDRRHASLAIWNRKVEPARDAYWYACLEAPRVEPVFSSAQVEVTPLRALARADEAAVAACARLGASRRLLGPAPLKATLRGSVTSSVAAAADVERVRLRVQTTKLVRP